MGLLSKLNLKKDLFHIAQKQKDMWDSMQRNGYFKRHPIYRSWSSGREEPSPVRKSDRAEKQAIPEFLSSIDFSAPEIIFDIKDVDPFKTFNDVIDPALKLAEDEWLPKIVDLTPEMTVLDIGCGYGRTEEWMRRYVRDIYGIDISDYIIGVCKRRFSEIDNVYFYVNSGYDLSMFEDAKFDFVYCFNVFQHIPRKLTEKYFQEIKRTLKQEGVFLFNMLSGINYDLDDGPCSAEWAIGYTEKDVDRLVKKSGLNALKTSKWMVRNVKPYWIWMLTKK